MDIKGVVAMMFMMIGMVVGQSVDPNPNFVDYSLTDDFTTFENSPRDVNKIPPHHRKPSPASPPFVIPPIPRSPIIPKSPPPTSHVPPKHNSLCLRKCQKNCSNDKVVVRKACFDACPSNCKIIHEASKSLKKCILACIQAIPTNYAPDFVVEMNMKGKLDSCYKTCSSRIKINN